MASYDEKQQAEINQAFQEYLQMTSGGNSNQPSYSGPPNSQPPYGGYPGYSDPYSSYPQNPQANVYTGPSFADIYGTTTKNTSASKPSSSEAYNPDSPSNDFSTDTASGSVPPPSYKSMPSFQSLGYDIPQKESQTDLESVNTNSTIYISGLPKDVTEKELAKHFGSIGVIKIEKKKQKPRIVIYRDKVTNEQKGDACITYEDPHAASSAIRIFNDKEFLGHIIKVEYAETKAPPPSFRGRGRGGRGGPSEHRGGFRGGRGRGMPKPPVVSEGDWTCPQCGNLNWARRTACKMCKIQKPSNISGPPGYEQGNEMENKPTENRGGPRGYSDNQGFQGGYSDRSSKRENQRYEQGGRSGRDDRYEQGSHRDFGGSERSSRRDRDEYRGSNFGRDRAEERRDRRDRPY